MTAPSLPKPFVISRTFDAPRALVWEVWTKTEHLMRWFGPRGFTAPVARLDLRPGGSFHCCLRNAQNVEIWGKWVFREVAPPERLAWAHSFSDPQGGVTRHPMSPTWPLELLTVVTFTESGGRTTVRLEWSTLNASATEQKTFDDSHGSMNGGWTGTFDQLEAYLAEVRNGGA